jgi:hypothetical protein
MKHPLARALALAALLSGCETGDNPQFFIFQNQVPSGNCSISANKGVYRGEGLLDVAVLPEGTATGYILHPLLQNDFPQVAGTGPEPNRLRMRGFQVRIEPAPAVPDAVSKLFTRLGNDARLRTLIEYEEPWSGSVAPGGVASASVVVVPGDLARQIRDTGALATLTHLTLFAKVRALGERQGGQTLRTEEFVYPIRVCQGCLVASLRACPYAPVNLGNPCNVAQDDPVDCCTEGGTTICPSRAVAITAPTTPPPMTTTPAAPGGAP